MTRYLLPMSMNGNEPLLLAWTYGGPSYLLNTAIWADVGACSTG